MKTLLACALLALPAAACAAAPANAALPPEFTAAAASPRGLTLLSAATTYQRLGEAAKAAALTRALPAWEAAGGPAPARLAAVAWDGGGELWQTGGAGPALLDSWSDYALPFAASKSGTDRFFGYFGGQYMKAKESSASSSGLNARLGRTFSRGRLDAALLFSYMKLGEDYSVSTYGLTARALFPLGKGLGWNLGGSFTAASPSEGDASNSLSALGGLNFYLPGGSFDVTLALGSDSYLSLLAGYTFYLGK